MKRILLTCCLVLITQNIYSQILWEINYDSAPRSPPSAILTTDSNFLVGTGDMRILKFDANGNYNGLFYQLPNNDAFWTSLDISDNKIIGHGYHSSGYNIFYNIIDSTGNQVNYYNVSSGQSGPGDVIVVNNMRDGRKHILMGLP